MYYEATRIITGGTKLCNLETSGCSRMGFIAERRTKHKLVIFYKIINNLSPNNLHESSNPLLFKIRTIYNNTDLFYNSFIPQPP